MSLLRSFDSLLNFYPQLALWATNMIIDCQVAPDIGVMFCPLMILPLPEKVREAGYQKGIYGH